VDFDEHGQCWIEACVIPHLFHMIQGGRYNRQGGEHFTINAEETARIASDRQRGKIVNPYIYDDIKTVADHLHYAGNKGPHAGNARSGAVGGGHAHAGMMVYQGDNWPEEYRDPNGEAVKRFAAEHSQHVDFQGYLQWIASEQLGAPLSMH